MTERDYLENLRNPVQLQKDLVSVYWSLPKREAVRLPELDNSKLNIYERRGILQIKAERDLERQSLGLVPKKLEELEKLLEIADITPFFKTNISESFQTLFKTGIKDGSDPTLDLLGLSPSLPLSEGIFSENPKIRMGIERGFNLILSEEVRELRERNKEYTNEELIEIIAMSEAYVQIHEEQFYILYGESANIPIVY